MNNTIKNRAYYTIKELNKVCIAHTFSKEQLIIQSDLIKNAKLK